MHNHCPVVGIDVAKDFSYYAVLSPQGEFFTKPFKGFNDKEGFEFVLRKLKKVENAFNSKPVIVLESTGHYSQRIVHFFCNQGFKVFLVNPLISHSIKSSLIRKVKTDKVDAEELARLYFIKPLQEIKLNSDYFLNLRVFSRTVVLLSEQRVNIINQLTAAIEQVMPTYPKIFSNIASETSLAILSQYSSLKALKQAHKEDIIKTICTFSRRGIKYAEDKYCSILKCVKDSETIGIMIDAYFDVINVYVSNLQHINSKIKEIEAKIEQLSVNIPAISLLKSIPGIGSKLASIIAGEIGDINRFNSAKQLVAFCGVDPTVKQSGNFTGTKNRITKRGSPFIRKALYVAASVVIRKSSKGNLVNPVIYEYYHQKVTTKSCKQVLGAIMNKLIRIIYSVLKNNKPFELITPQEQERRYKLTFNLAS